MTKDKIFRYVTLIVLILETLPIIKGYLYFPQILIMSGVILLGIILYPKSFFNKATINFILLIVIVFINIYLKNKYDPKWYFIIFMYWFFILAVFNVFTYNKDYNGIKLISISCLIILLLTSIISLPLLIKSPMLVRDFMEYEQNGNLDMVHKGQRLGLISYGLIHAIPTLFPVLIFLFRKSNKVLNKAVWIVLIILFYYLVLKVSFGTVLILSTLIIPVSFFISAYRKRNIFLFSVILLFCLPLLSKDNLVNSLDNVKAYFQNSIIYDKIEEIQTTIKTGEGEGDIGNRTDLYTNSWSVFFKNTISGTMNHDDAGGHAFIADFLAWFGLIGTIPLLLFFFNIFKQISKQIKTDQKVYYFLCMFPFLFLSLLKGTPSYEQILFIFVVIPGLFITSIPTVKIKNIKQNKNRINV